MSSTTRRAFLKTSAAAASLAYVPTFAHADGNNSMLKIGLIGCGGRGTGAAQQALTADSNVKLWAVGDAFPGPRLDPLPSASPPAAQSRRQGRCSTRAALHRLRCVSASDQQRRRCGAAMHAAALSALASGDGVAGGQAYLLREADGRGRPGRSPCRRPGRRGPAAPPERGRRLLLALLHADA